MNDPELRRADGKLFTRDSRGQVPNLVVEDNEDGEAVLYHQFYGFVEPIGPRPYGIDEVYAATRRMMRRVKSVKEASK